MTCDAGCVERRNRSRAKPGVDFFVWITWNLGVIWVSPGTWDHLEPGITWNLGSLGTWDHLEPGITWNLDHLEPGSPGTWITWNLDHLEPGTWNLDHLEPGTWITWNLEPGSPGTWPENAAPDS
jgi:hypothetical protein